MQKRKITVRVTWTGPKRTDLQRLVERFVAGDGRNTVKPTSTLNVLAAEALGGAK